MSGGTGRGEETVSYEDGEAAVEEPKISTVRNVTDWLCSAYGFFEHHEYKFV